MTRRAGMRTTLRGSGAWFLGGGSAPSHSETALMSGSDSRVAMRCMQSGAAALRSPVRQRVSCAAM